MGGPLIALVESDPTYAQNVADYLAEAGYQVRRAAIGCEALRLVQSAQPRLVLTAAELDHAQGGWILLNVLRRLPDTAAVPVILYSDDEPYLEAICDLIEDPRYQFRTRPLDLADLARQIEELLAISR